MQYFASLALKLLRYLESKFIDVYNYWCIQFYENRYNLELITHTHEKNAAVYCVGVCYILLPLFSDDPPDQIGRSCRPWFYLTLERLRVTRSQLVISHTANCHAEPSDLIAPGNHSISGSITLPCSSDAFETLNVESVIATERKTEDSARCCPGHVLCTWAGRQIPNFNGEE
jgi:hypothetical protein